MSRFSWILMLFGILVLFLSMVIVVACGDDGEDDDDDDTCTKAWIDPNTGLMWQLKPTGGRIRWYDIDNHCGSLDLCGYNNWHEPNISELRSLVRGCPVTETDGACGVTEKCNEGDCSNDDCEGCNKLEGPSDGCYWPMELEGTCTTRYWSSTPMERVGADYWSWCLHYSMGEINLEHVDVGEKLLVRCVRK